MGAWGTERIQKQGSSTALVFSQGLIETEDMIGVVDGASNDDGIVENRGGSEPYRNGRNMTETESVQQEAPTSGKH